MKTTLKNNRECLRTCIGCRQVKNKRELVRLTCTHEEIVEIDLTWKKQGRGMYLCPVESCWRRSLEKGRLEYASRVKLGDDNRQSLLFYSRGFLKK